MAVPAFTKGTDMKRITKGDVLIAIAVIAIIGLFGFGPRHEIEGCDPVIHTSQETPITEPAIIDVEDLLYCNHEQQLFAYIRARESDGSSWEELHEPGLSGELGIYQITPGFIQDITQWTGEDLDPHDRVKVEKAIIIWLDHYCSRINIDTIGPAYLVYNLGYKGYKVKYLTK